jgi:hypothetical protein
VSFATTVPLLDKYSIGFERAAFWSKLHRSDNYLAELQCEFYLHFKPDYLRED